MQLSDHSPAALNPAAEAEGSAAQWTRVATVSDIAAGKPKVVRPDGRQIVLFATDAGLRACNNRCPHEGYPLSEGSLSACPGGPDNDDGCVITCNWHNWKFSLDTGDNLLGGDALRTYPLEVRDGEVWLDLAELPRPQRVRAAYLRLGEAFDDNDYARLARETARLRLLDTPGTDIVAFALRRALPRMEYGWTHAVAGACEWLALARETAAADAAEEVELTCLLEVIGHLADDTLREPDYPFTEAVLPWDESAFLDALEAEDEASAVARVHGALEAGMTWAMLEPGFARAALAHYYNFGHSLIYVHHAGKLLAAMPADVHPLLLASLTRHICAGSREDLIPEFRGYAAALSQFRRTGGVAAEPAPANEALDWRVLRKISVQAAMDAVSRSGGDHARTFETMLATVAAQLLSFDLSQQSRVDGGVADNTSWLDLTHGITFAEAAHALCQHNPTLWPAALLQLACFSGRNRGFTTDKVALASWEVTDVQAFTETQRVHLLDHGCDEFIASVHRLKTLRAGVRLALAPGTARETAALVLAGVHRYLASPLKLKHARRTARQARAFVALDG